MAWQSISPDVNVKGPRQWMGLMMLHCDITVKRMQMLGVSLWKMKALTVTMEAVTLIGKG
jgi:hypothetical protein